MHITNCNIQMRKSIIITVSIIISIICFSCQKSQERIEYKKIWLHRANEIQKAKYFQDKYDGLEIDITYLDSLNTFIVFHGGGLLEPEPVTLEHWLDEVEKANKLGLWLDFKNLNHNNKMQAFNELNRLCSKYKINKGNLIVESQSAPDLTVFKEAGYPTSYYIHYFNPQQTSPVQAAGYFTLLNRLRLPHRRRAPYS